MSFSINKFVYGEKEKRKRGKNYKEIKGQRE